MSQENNVIFTRLKKRCERVRSRVEDDQDVPFTISWNNATTSNSNCISDNHNKGNATTTVVSGFEEDEEDCAEKRYVQLKSGDYLPPYLKESFDYKNLCCKPLEEVDPAYLKKKTFLVVGTDGKVHRFAGKASSFIFNPFNRLRRIGIHILCNWQLPVLIGISLICFCLSFVLPNYVSDAVLTIVWNFTRYFLGSLLVAEICVNVLAKGILVAEFTYLRSPWDWFDICLLAVVLLNLHWKTLLVHSLEGVIVLKFIPIVPALRTGFHLIVQIFKNFVPVLIYSLLTLWILAIVGWHIKTHQLRKEAIHLDNCPTPMNANNVSNLPTLPNANQYPNHTNDKNYLPNIHDKDQAILDEWDNKLNASKYNLECFRNYTSSSVFFPLANITIQTMRVASFNTFVSAYKEIDHLSTNVLHVTLTLIFGSFGILFLTSASVAFTTFTARCKNDNVPESRTVGFPRCPFQASLCDENVAFSTCRKLVFHPLVELFLYIVVWLDICLVSLEAIDIGENDMLRWIINSGQKVCMIIYVLEILLKLVFGTSWYFRDPWVLAVDFVAALVCIINFALPTSFVKVRILKLFPRCSTIALIIYSWTQSIRERVNLILIMLMILLCVRYFSECKRTGCKDRGEIIFFSVNGLVFSSSNISRENNTDLVSDIALIMTELCVKIVLFSVILISVIEWTVKVTSNPFDNNHTCKRIQAGFATVQSSLVKVCSRKNAGQTCSGTRNPNTTPSVPNHLPLPTLPGGVKYHQSPQPRQAKLDNSKSFDTEASQMSRPESDISTMSLVRQRIQDNFDSGLILLAFLFSVIEYPSSGGISAAQVLRLFIDLIFICYFLTTLLKKLFRFPNHTLRDIGWVFDFLVVFSTGIVTGISVLSISATAPIFDIIAAISLLKGLMLFHRVQWIKAGVNGFTSQIRLLWQYFLAVFVVWIFIHLMTNAQLKSDNSNKLEKSINFPVFCEMLEKVGVLLIQTLLVGTFIGVIVAEFLKSEALSTYMTAAQCAIYKDKVSFQREKTHHIPAPKSGLCSQITHYATLTNAFDIAMSGTILLDCSVITFSHLALSKEWQTVWEYYPYYINSMYALEFLLKLVGWRKYFWKSMWNIFDAIVVVIGIIDLMFIKFRVGFITTEHVRFFRICRIFQLNVFLKKAVTLKLTRSVLLRVLPVLGNLLAVCTILCYTYVVIGLHNGIKTISESDESSSALSTDLVQKFDELCRFLLLFPIYGNVESIELVLTPPSWTSFMGVVLMIYIYSWRTFTVLMFAIVFAILVSDLFKTFSLCQAAHDEKEAQFCPETAVETDNLYKNMNGCYLNCEFPRTPDDPDSVATMLTPIEPEHNVVEDVLSDEDKYPLRISANGYILRVEAVVTTV